MADECQPSLLPKSINDGTKMGGRSVIVKANWIPPRTIKPKLRPRVNLQNSTGCDSLPKLQSKLTAEFTEPMNLTVNYAAST